MIRSRKSEVKDMAAPFEKNEQKDELFGWKLYD